MARAYYIAMNLTPDQWRFIVRALKIVEREDENAAELFEFSEDRPDRRTAAIFRGYVSKSRTLRTMIEEALA